MQKAATEKTQYPRNDKILKNGENGHLQKPKYDKMVKNSSFCGRFIKCQKKNQTNKQKRDIFDHALCRFMETTSTKNLFYVKN